MNKWQIYCPVIALLIVANVGVFRQKRIQHRAYVASRTETIAYNLLNTNNSPYLVSPPSDLLVQVATLKRHPAGIQSHGLGDTAAPVGNDDACSHFILTNAVSQELGVRLEQSGKNFEVLGYWTNWQ